MGYFGAASGGRVTWEPVKCLQCSLLAALLLCHAAVSAAEGKEINRITQMDTRQSNLGDDVTVNAVTYSGKLPDQCRTRAPLECGFVHIPLESILFRAGVLEVASFQGSCTDSCLDYLAESPSCKRLPELQQTMRKICKGYDCSNSVEAACGSTASGALVEFEKACSQDCQEALDADICEDIDSLLPAYSLYRERLGVDGSECRQHACHTELTENCSGYDAESLSMPWSELCDEGCYAVSTREVCLEADVVLTGADRTKAIATWAQFAQDPTLFGPESEGCRSIVPGEPLPDINVPNVTESVPGNDSISNPEQALRFDTTFPDLTLEDVVVDGSTDAFRAEVEAKIRELLSLLGDYEVVNIVVGEPRAGSIIVPVEVEFADGTFPEEVLATLNDPANACDAAGAAFASLGSPVLLEGLQGAGVNAAPSTDVDCSGEPEAPGFSVVDVGFDEEGEGDAAEGDGGLSPVESVPSPPIMLPPVTPPPVVAVTESSRDGSEGAALGSPSSGNTVVIIIGSIVGVALILAILIGAMMFVRRKRRNDNDSEASREAKPDDVESKGQDSAGDGRGGAAEALIGFSQVAGERGGESSNGKEAASNENDAAERTAAAVESSFHKTERRGGEDEDGRAHRDVGGEPIVATAAPKFESESNTSSSPLDTTAERLDAIIPKLDMSSLASSPEKPNYRTPRNDSGTTTFRTAHETSAPTTYRTAGEGSSALTTWRTARDSFESCSETGDGFETARSGEAGAGPSAAASVPPAVVKPSYKPAMLHASQHNVGSNSDVDNDTTAQRVVASSSLPARVVKPYMPTLNSAPGAIIPTPLPSTEPAEFESALTPITMPLAAGTFLGLSTKGWWGSRSKDESVPAAVEAVPLPAAAAHSDQRRRSSATAEDDSFIDAESMQNSAIDTTNFSDANSTFRHALDTTTFGRSAAGANDGATQRRTGGAAWTAPTGGATLGGNFSQPSSRRSTEESFRSAANTAGAQSVAGSMYRTTGESFQSASEAMRASSEDNLFPDVEGARENS
jgi:hypothetical protein